MQSENNTKRDGRATRIPAEPEAEQVVALLDDDATTRGQRDFINKTVRELSDETGVSLPQPGTDLRDFYLEAAYSLGAANPRWRMRELLKMIAEGERFDDYKKGDVFYIWKEKRARRNHSGTKETAAELEKRLSDPKTPTDYKVALKKALRAYCATVQTKYDEKAPAWTYTEAAAESEQFSTGSDNWHMNWDARANITSLLEGLRKRRCLSSVELRGGRRETVSTETRAKKQTAAGGKRQRTFWLASDAPHVGFIRGEGVNATRTEELQVWDIAVAQRKGEEQSGIGRVVAVSADSIVIRRASGDEIYHRAGLHFLGRVDPEPVGMDDGLTDEQRAEVGRLHEKLEGLGDEDDQILRCTARYKYEKEIYDLLHPVGEGKSPDDWSAWEGRGDV
jgi:hypothetical protein